jgi:hypothetical protein
VLASAGSADVGFAARFIEAVGLDMDTGRRSGRVLFQNHLVEGELRFQANPIEYLRKTYVTGSEIGGTVPVSE